MPRGGAEGTRTPYLNTASVALSRMSYSPVIIDPLKRPLSGANRRPLLSFTVAAHERVRRMFTASHQPAAR